MFKVASVKLSNHESFVLGYVISFVVNGMYFWDVFNNVQIICTILLAFTAVIGDFLVEHSKLHIYKAVFDNTTHSIIGGLTWLIICLKTRNRSSWRLLEIFICATIASVIDLDHFVAAKSIYLKDATNLQGRPALHCTTIPIVLTILLILLAKWYLSVTLYHFAWIIFAAFLSHHIRDATRRGFWFFQKNEVNDLKYYLYFAFGGTWILMVMLFFTIIYMVRKFNNLMKEVKKQDDRLGDFMILKILERECDVKILETPSDEQINPLYSLPKIQLPAKQQAPKQLKRMDINKNIQEDFDKIEETSPPTSLQRSRPDSFRNPLSNRDTDSWNDNFSFSKPREESNAYY